MSANKLEVQLSADIIQFERGIDEAKRSLRVYSGQVGKTEKDQAGLNKQFALSRKQMENYGRGLTNVAGMATAAFAGAAVGAVAHTRAVAEQAREIERQATVAQVSVEQIQALGYASEQYSISGDKMADILKDVNDKIGDFTENEGGEFADFMKNIAPTVGLTIDQLQKLSGPEALVAVKAAMDQANVPMKSQIFYLESIASDASALMPLLDNQGRKLYELTKKYDDLNVSMSEYDIEKFKDMDQKLKDTGLKLQRTFANAVLGASDQIDWFTDKLVVSVDYWGALFDSMSDNPRTKNGLLKKLGDARDEARTVKIELERAQKALEGLQATEKSAEGNVEVQARLANSRFSEKVSTQESKVAKLTAKYKALIDTVNKYQRQYENRELGFNRNPNGKGSGTSKPQPPIRPPKPDSDSSELDRLQVAGASRLAALEMQFATEREKLSLSHEQRKADIEALELSKQEIAKRGYQSLEAIKEEYLNRENEFYGRELDAFKKKEDEKAKASADNAKRIAAMEETLNRERLRSVGGFMGQLSQLQNSENKNAARIGKTAARFQIMLNAYESATAAYKSLVGIPYVGPALAAAAAGSAMGFGISMASKVDSLSGMAHSGISEIPAEGTWLLNKGERVYTNQSANQLDLMFNAIMAMHRKTSAINDPSRAISKAAMVGGGRNIVNIYGAPEGTKVQERQGENGENFTDVFLEDLDSDGPMSQGITQYFDAKRVGMN
ncbi:hypothetical protein M3890_001031 [Vibrio parahaemolyticus]|nr:hypothetical protein [Vibrio parahaemolyticus]MDG3415486.1 hypothetical protein [Vibrio parahaemolyticus]HBC3541904.1 hypothetical protein [Vibrio parahaemolyticus]HBC3546918.1 hypothetical protein [Vibrio parahaemolyticus]HBC3570590.1 hypothetical protein [Vibrio parahaemolyticus]